MGRRLRALRELTLTRYREFLREPEAVFWTFGFPLFLAIGLGIAFRHRPPEVLKVAVIGDSAVAGFASTSAALALQSVRSESLLAVSAADSASAVRDLRTGKLALVIRAGALASGKSEPEPQRSRVRLRVREDVTVAESLTVAEPAGSGARLDSVTYEYDATRPEAQRARLLVDNALQRGGRRADPIRVGERRITEAGSRYIDFFIPGLLGMNLMGSGIWGVAFSVVTARNRKLLKRLSATPMSRLDYLLSFVLSRLTFLVLEVIILLGFGRLVFGVPMRGSLAVLALVSLIGAFCFSALGMLVASRVRTIEGVSGLTNLVMVPMWIMSGVFFSSSNFPDVAQPFIKALPLTAANDALRANMLQGAGLAEVSSQILVMLVWFVVSLVIALRIFRWR